ncbi:MAG: hypothetical protein ACFKPT_05050 [Gloeotrichia echinulata GP01]
MMNLDMNMPKKCSFFTAIVVLSLVNILTCPTTVNAQTQTTVCRGAIANAKTRVQRIPNVLIEQVWTRNNNELYSNVPTGRPLEYIFYLTGPKRNGLIVEAGIKKIENSPQFIKGISQEIINNCSSVSSVSFGSVLAPGCSITFGLMSDGAVKAFQDVDASDGRQLKWGESFCN